MVELVYLFVKDVISSRIGAVLIAIAVVVVLYEGVPIGPLRYIPYAGPALAYVFDGRVDHVREGARAEYEAEARARAMALIEKRNHDNAEITDMDASTLCGELGGRWVPGEQRCD